MKLETKRFILRNPTKKDVDDLIRGLNPLEVSRFLANVPHPYTKKDALWWINNCAKDLKKKEREKYAFNIELKSEKKLIGGIGLHDIDDFSKTAEIGYWVNKKYWKQGIISEAMKEILDFAFYRLKLRRLSLYAYTNNVASNIVAKKFGFKFEGVSRKYQKTRSTGKIYDANMYGLLKEDWVKQRRRLK